MRRSAALLTMFALACILAGCGASSPGSPVIRIGAVFPLTGPAGRLGRQEFDSFKMAARSQIGPQLHGRRIDFDVRDVPTAERVASAVNSLAHDGVAMIVGGYSSDISVPAAYDTAKAHLVYWEAGAEATQVTGRGLATVFRVGATGRQLGDNSARFLVDRIAPRMHMRPSKIRASVVTAEDAYASSVSSAVVGELDRSNVSIVSRSHYDAYHPDWAPIIEALRKARPDVVFLTSHVPDGIAFRRAFVKARLHVSVFIGTTMAQCRWAFAKALGKGAVGVFGSDRPGSDLDPQKLSRRGQHLYAELATAWKRHHRGKPGEEALSGFTAGWVLFHKVLPAVRGRLSTAAIAASARRVELPFGSLPNGAGVKFATGRRREGQNLRAAAVIRQWQTPQRYSVVWPATYATARIDAHPSVKNVSQTRGW